jgi:hypothetical protein
MLLRTRILGPLFLLFGCTGVPLADRNVGVDSEQFPDLPVPHGLKLQDRHHESHTLSVGLYRYADLLYTGNTPVPDVVAYLVERLPQHSWQLESAEEQGRMAHGLVFCRDDYRVSYRIESRDNRTDVRVELRSSAKPLGQG